MIQFADEITRPQVREMWKTVFGDPDDYMEVYFRHKYRDENCLLYIEGGKAVASLQMLPYRFTFCGSEIPVIYLSGVSTLPAYRNRGYVRQLLLRCFEEAACRDVPLVLLVPQEDWLLDFYGQYGFAQAFDTGEKELLSLKGLSDSFRENPQATYREFDKQFRYNDMTVQKTFEDFCAIMEEAVLYDYPPKKNLRGMARVIDTERLLSLFAGCYPQLSFSVAVRDELVKENNALFTVSGGKVVIEKNFTSVKSTLTANIHELAQLLLGYHTSAKKAPINTLFPEKIPQMHFMLE